MDENGKWVCDTDMHPTTNIAGRRWKTSDGEFNGVYSGMGLPDKVLLRGVLWYFPAINSDQ